MKNKKKIIILMSIAFVFVVIGFTYAFVSYTLNGQKRQIITASDLSVELLEDEELIIENALPMYDEVGKIQEDYFSFQVVNKSNYKVDYTLHLADITEEAVDKLNYEDVKYYLTKEKEERAPKLLSERDNDIIDTGSIAKKSTIHYTLRLWIDSNVEDNNEIYQKMLKFKLVAEIKKEAKEQYKVHYETGTDLVIEDGLKVEGEDLVLTDITPEKENYNFLGWTTTEGGDVEYEAGSIYSEDQNITLYAVWGLRTYTITYNVNGGVGEIEQQIKTHGQSLTLTTSAPTKSGYVFIGWATTATASEATYIKGATFNIDADTELYAIYGPSSKTINVSYKLNNHTSNPSGGGTPSVTNSGSYSDIANNSNSCGRGWGDYWVQAVSTTNINVTGYNYLTIKVQEASCEETAYAKVSIGGVSSQSGRCTTTTLRLNISKLSGSYPLIIEARGNTNANTNQCISAHGVFYSITLSA